MKEEEVEEDVEETVIEEDDKVVVEYEVEIESEAARKTKGFQNSHDICNSKRRLCRS